MKQFIWLLCGIFLSGLLLGTLSSCGADQYGVTVMTTGPLSAREETTSAAGNGNGQDSGSETRRLAYGAVLWDAYLKGTLPDGTRLECPGGGELLGPVEGNEFALADVDGDGEEELLLWWTNASMAGMEAYVFGFRNGTVYQELCEFPSLTFYDNGAVQADWSHNQGWAGRIWPYTIYQYFEDTQDYVQMAGVDAWDITCTEETFPGAFPEDVDADGDGLVYFLLSGEWYGRDFTAPNGRHYETWSVPPVDGDAYQRWWDSWFGGGSVIKVPFQELTEETIAALGCPRPEVTYPEPAG